MQVAGGEDRGVVGGEGGDAGNILVYSYVQWGAYKGAVEEGYGQSQSVSGASCY